jgi:hypothetical protein
MPKYAIIICELFSERKLYRMNLTQEQLLSLIFMVGFGLAYLTGKVLEAIFNKEVVRSKRPDDGSDDWEDWDEERSKRLDLGSYSFWVGLGAIVCLLWVYHSFGGN